MVKKRHERCPFCGFLDTIKWGVQSGHQRYKCKNCGSLFTARRKDVSRNNRFVWFRWWVERKQTIEQISSLSGYSVRQLKTWFYEYLDKAPTWKIKRRGSVNLLIDGTWFPNKVCLVVYRADNIKATLFYRLTDDEKEWEIIRDLQTLRRMGLRISSVTSDGGPDIVRAVKYACPDAIRQRCLAHIERECLAWITQHPKSAAGIELRRLVCKISHIKTHNDELYWIRCLHEWHDEYSEFLKEKTISPTTGQKSYTHDSIRKAFYHIWRALPDMFRFIDHPDIPKTTNGLESFFGHIKDHLRVHRGLSLKHHQNFVKWYLFFNGKNGNH
ncbi:MAG: transposase [Verrucomicrobia bacterium]|nr:transposase [Verrucomicrobiota bacterium]